MRRTQRRVWLAGAAATALAVTLLPPGTAAAQDGAPDGAEVNVEVVAEGLDVPRGLAYDRLLGRVLVAEAGNAAGNDGACAAGFGGTLYCYGETGGIYQHSERWWLPSKRIVSGLPSIWAPEIASIFEVVLGVHDVALPLGTGPVVGVFGLSGPLSFRDELEAEHPRAAELSTTGWILPNGTTLTTADLAQYEQDENPHPRNLDADPYGVTTRGLNTIVVDAAGNFVVEVDLFGRVNLLAVLPDFEDPERPEVTLESVPTTVAYGPDGALYIGELGAAGAPQPGASRVWRLADGELELFAEGFTTIISIDFDHQGRLMVLEIAQNGYYTNPRPDGDRTGRLVRVEDDGSHTTLLTDPLDNPGGIVAAKPGVFYITNHSSTLGGDGELLRVTVAD